MTCRALKYGLDVPGRIGSKKQMKGHITNLQGSEEKV